MFNNPGGITPTRAKNKPKKKINVIFKII